MKTERLNHVLRSMEKQGIPQMIISDPVAIFYLTGKWIFSGERLNVLYLNTSGKHKLVINALFPQEEDSSLEMVWYRDTEDAVALVASFLDADKPLGVDKKWPAEFLLRLQELHGASRYCNGSPILDRVRMIKDEEEQQKMRAASRANDRIMEALIPLTAKGYTEREMEKIAQKLYEDSGHDNTAFPAIIAYGKSGADPHHTADGTKGREGDSVVLDIGGVLDGYCSDMTRTVFLGHVTGRAREIYEIVKEAQRRGLEAAKPGNRMCDVDFACRHYIEEKGYGEYFTHRTGHSIGLEDHEFGDVSAVNEDIIQPGQCFSVEPGIYLPQESLGVRIEDLVLITQTGNEVLNQVSKDLRIVPFSEE